MVCTFKQARTFFLTPHLHGVVKEFIFVILIYIYDFIETVPKFYPSTPRQISFRGEEALGKCNVLSYRLELWSPTSETLRIFSLQKVGNQLKMVQL